MTKEELLEVEGVVIALLPNLMSRVVLDNGKEIRPPARGGCGATASGSWSAIG